MGQPVPRLLVLQEVNTTNAVIINKAKTRIFFIKFFLLMHPFYVLQIYDAINNGFPANLF